MPSAQLSSVAALAVPDPFALPEVAADVLDVPRPGVMVTVVPSGIVVVPVKPPGPVFTLLDMAPDGGALLSAACAWRSALVPLLEDGDAVLAEDALDEVPPAVAQARLVCRSGTAPEVEEADDVDDAGHAAAA